MTAPLTRSVRAALALALAACGGPRPVAVPVPDGWVRVDDPRGVSFAAPRGVRGGPVQGIDSEVGEYAAGDLRISYDLGLYSSWLCEDPVTSRERRTINGRPARVITAHDPGATERPYSAAAYFPAPPGEGRALTLSVDVRIADELPAALAVLATVVWRAPRGGDGPVTPCPRLEITATTLGPGARCPVGHGEVRVRLVDAGGAPLAGTTIVIAGEAAITDDDGAATLCAPAGRPTLGVFFADTSTERPIDVVAGQLTTVTARQAE